MPKLKMVCAECGSDDVLADTYASWSTANQQWEVMNVFDKGHYCNACEGECKIEEEELDDV